MRIVPQSRPNWGTFHAEISLDWPWSDDVDGNALGAQLFGHGNGHSIQSSLRSTVHRQHERTQPGNDAGNVDDASSCLHVWKSSLNQQERTTNVDMKDRTPVLKAHGSNAFSVHDGRAGVVDDDIDGLGVECLQGSVDENFAKISGASIGFDCNSSNSETLELGDCLFCWSGRAIVMDGDLRACQLGQ